MSDIISFEERWLERTEHTRGKVKCLNCKDEWNVIASVGACEFNCQKCNTMTGVYCTTISPETVFECECGNDLYYIAPEGMFCAKCSIQLEIVEG